MLNQLLQRVWNRSDPAHTVTRLSDQRNLTVAPVTDGHVLTLIQRMMGAGKSIWCRFQRSAGHDRSGFQRPRTNPAKPKNTGSLARLPGWFIHAQISCNNPNGDQNRQPLGQGIRFTDQSRQAKDRPDGKQRLVHGAIYEVHLGNQLELTTHKPEQVTAHFLNSMAEHYDSVFVRQGNQLSQTNLLFTTRRSVRFGTLSKSRREMELQRKKLDRWLCGSPPPRSFWPKAIRPLAVKNALRRRGYEARPGRRIPMAVRHQPVGELDHRRQRGRQRVYSFPSVLSAS